MSKSGNGPDEFMNQSNMEESINYTKYYSLDDYLFNEVRKNFHKNGVLTPEEFFCIIIWKSNRNKAKIKENILEKYKGCLRDAVSQLTREIYNEKDQRKRLEVLLDKWGFKLSIATAILTVLYPDEFTVYDYRVRGEIGINDFTYQNEVISRYFTEFISKVKEAGKGKTLRDKDKYLWGKSFWKDLNKFIGG